MHYACMRLLLIILCSAITYPTSAQSGFSDTLYERNDLGQIKRMELYSDSGYIRIDFWQETGMIKARGEFSFADSTRLITVRDSTGWIRYQNRWFDSVYTIPTGTWFAFFENGQVQSEGQYFPADITTEEHYEDTNSPGTFVLIVIVTRGTLLRDGTWLYYDESGRKIREEFYEGGLLKSKTEY